MEIDLFSQSQVLPSQCYYLLLELRNLVVPLLDGLLELRCGLDRLKKLLLSLLKLVLLLALTGQLLLLTL